MRRRQTTKGAAASGKNSSNLRQKIVAFYVCYFFDCLDFNLIMCGVSILNSSSDLIILYIKIIVTIYVDIWFYIFICEHKYIVYFLKPFTLYSSS